MIHINEKDAVFMTGIDQDIFDREVNGETVRFSLDQPMKAAREVRKILVSLAKKPVV